MTETFPYLREPIKIGNVELKNRMIAAPMVSLLCREDGYSTDRMVEHYRLRGRGGFAMVIVEGTAVRHEARVTSRMLSLALPNCQTGAAEIAEAIREGGAKAAIQLVDIGGNADSTWTGVRSLAPSNVTLRTWVVPPDEMTEDEIGKSLDNWAKAAVRAQRAGFDMIQIHGAHGMLINQFMTPYLNRRTDRWGEPATYAVEVIKRLKKEVDCPVFIRISGDDFLDSTPAGRLKNFSTTYARDPNKFGAANLEHMLRLVPRLVEAGADAIDVSAGNGASISDFWIIQPIYKSRGVIVHLAEAIKKVVRVPVITAGRICDPRLAENIVARGRADIVGFGRVAYADTDFAKKVLQARPDDIRMCTACDYCTALMTLGESGAKCAINYEVGKLPYEYQLNMAMKPKKVMVVGGGVAGMEAARVAATRGHRVTLYERENELGGSIARLGSRIPRLNTRDLNNVVKWQVNQLEKCGAQVELGKGVTPSLVELERPDVVIVATGARPYVPDTIAGIDHKKVVVLDDYLTEKRTDIGENVVVVGGDHGAEVACSLARRGKKVTLVERTRRIGQAPYLTARWALLLDYLRETNVEILYESELKEVRDEGVRITLKDGKERLLEADTVILALDRVPNSELFGQLEGRVPELYEVGDCVTPKHMQNAIHSAYRVAREI